MALVKLGHYAVRTSDLEASRRFYVEGLGLRVGYRPPFGFPGLWLYLGDDEASFGVVHLIGADPSGALDDYLGEGGAGGGQIDHIAFLAADWPAMRDRCDGLGLDYAQRTVPMLGLHQVFLRDPSGVTVELNFPSAEAPSAAKTGR
jgi:catechol 2,3-dioxygenase-like lactoylglutathione lyase family enzyme